MSTDTAAQDKAASGSGILERLKIRPQKPAAEPDADAGRLRRFGALLRKHWILTALIVIGAVLRVITMIAYQPALLFIDSFRYLGNLQALSPDGLNPLGYTLFIKPIMWLGDLGTIAAVQHVLGIGVAITIYSLALRYGARRWLAAIAAAPMLLDAYQLQIEQLVMSDVLFQAMLVAAIWVMVSRGAPTNRRVFVAGLLFAAAVLVRSVGIALVVPGLLYLVLMGAKWRYPGGWREIGRRVASFLLAFVIVIGAYNLYSWSYTGNPGITAPAAKALYGRTAVVADCNAMELTAYERQMCPNEPLGERLGPDQYAHRDGGSPNWPAVLPEGTLRSELMVDFGLEVVKQQPLDVLGAIALDFTKGFSPIRDTLPGDVPVERWQFQTEYPLYGNPGEAQAALELHDDGQAVVNAPLASFLRDYQLHGGYTPGPLQALALLFGILGAAGFMSRGSGMRSTTLLVTGTAFTLLVTAAAFEFSWRYQLPAVALLPLAGVLGVTALMGPQRRPKQVRLRPKLAAFPDQVDAAALAEFENRYGKPKFAPVCIVIAAYNEEGGIGAVLDDMPRTAHGMDVDVLVVSDGSRDATADVARAHGAYVCVPPANRGQGAALRLSYRLAAGGGAKYVVSTDADGQYDNSELEKLLQPLVDDEADFVTGSRRLGTEHAADSVRWLGTRVFALLASVLTMRNITDTSFGFRAMRAEVASTVTLKEPQYQSSELMLGVLANRARLVELPMTMLIRNAGKTKKGNNITYGANYARVMTTTWVREFVFRRIVPRRSAKPANAETEKVSAG